jgi:hypothetical protein
LSRRAPLPFLRRDKDLAAAPMRHPMLPAEFVKRALSINQNRALSDPGG